MPTEGGDPPTSFALDTRQKVRVYAALLAHQRHSRRRPMRPSPAVFIPPRSSLAIGALLLVLAAASMIALLVN